MSDRTRNLKMAGYEAEIWVAKEERIVNLFDPNARNPKIISITTPYRSAYTASKSAMTKGANPLPYPHSRRRGGV